jgi:hypothetical protein
VRPVHAEPRLDCTKMPSRCNRGKAKKPTIIFLFLQIPTQFVYKNIQKKNSNQT